MKNAVFLDRDGVITKDPPHYAHTLNQFKLIPGSAEAIKLLNKSGFIVVVISNQSGVARGYYKEDEVGIFNKILDSKLKEKDALIDAIYYCPHHPEYGEGQYRMNCECRKPKPGMILQAAKDYDIELARSYMIGDKISDIEAGDKAGCKTILVGNKEGHKTCLDKNNGGIIPGHITNNLFEAVQWIINTDIIGLGTNK